MFLKNFFTWMQSAAAKLDPGTFSLVIPALIFTAILLFFTGILFFARYRRSRGRLVGRITAERPGQEAARSSLLSPGAQSSKDPVMKMLGAVGSRLQPDQSGDWKRRNLDFLRAGIRKNNALAVFWGAKALLALFPACAFLAMKPVLFPLLPASRTMLIGMVLAFVGFYLPDLWLKNRISERKRKIQDSLPDALDLLVVCVEAGMGLDSAIQRVGEEIRLQDKELSDEFMLMNLEVRAGKLRRDAMKNLALRTDLDDIKSLVTLLIQTDKFGTSVAQALRVYSDAFRTARMQRAEEIAAKLPVKMILPLALFIFPSMFVVLLGPAIIQIFRAFIHK